MIGWALVGAAAAGVAAVAWAVGVDARRQPGYRELWSGPADERRRGRTPD